MIPIIDQILQAAPSVFLVIIAILTMFAAWCAMLSKDLIAILIAGAAFEIYAFLFNDFYQQLYLVDAATFVWIVTLIECGAIGLFLILKLYNAWTGGWKKLKKDQFKATQK